MNIIDVTQINFSYPESNFKAVNNVSFQIKEGDYCTIVGPNGSGKSTIARLLSGLCSPDSGNIIVNPDTSIGMVFQSPKDQIVSGEVLRDTSFGPQNLKLPESEIELRTIECLNIVDLLEKAKSSTTALSLGQTQKLAVSGVLAIWPKVMILDEAVAMLDPSSKHSVLDFLKYWNRHGNTVIHITHDIEAISQSKRVIGFDKGKIFFDGATKDFLSNSKYVLNVTGPELKKIDKEKATKKICAREDVFVFKDIFFCYKSDITSGVNGINFKLKKGSLTAFTGPSGAGKSTIMELGAGLLEPDSGHILGTNFPSFALQNSADAVFENFASDDVAFGLINQGVKGQELKLRVKTAMDSVNLPFDDFKDKYTSRMSGGELKRLSLAGIIALDKDIMFFDEPTAGLDGKSKYEVMMLLRKLADSGKTIVYSTHDRKEAEFADREIVIEKGSVKKDTINDYNFDEICHKNNLLMKELKTYDSIKILEKIKLSSISMSGSGKEKKSIIEKIIPSVRILLFLLLLIPVFIFNNTIPLLVVYFLAFLYVVLSGAKLKKFFKACLKVFPFILLVCILQIVFYPPLENEVYFTTWKWFTITPSKLLFCLNTVLKSNSVIACIYAFFASMSEYDFIDGLKVLLKPLEVLHVPVRYFIVIMEIMFRFIPILVEEAQAIVKTQIVRGAMKNTKGVFSKIKAFIPLIIPMIIQSIRKSEALADAITIRCFK